MNISSTQAVGAALQGVSNVENKRAALQISLLKKALESQQDEAAQVLKMMEGKGQTVDLRV